MLDKMKRDEKSLDEGLMKLIQKNSVKIEYFDRKSISAEMRENNHQGYIAELDISKLMMDYKNFTDKLKVEKSTTVLILGELEDAQNVGSIIRTSVAMGVSGILIPEHNQVQINAGIIKVSAGMAFHVPLVSIPNVNNAVKDLKERGFWIYGLDMDGEKYIYEEDFSEPTAIIIGSEGDGLRLKTKEACDMILKIPMMENCESLNAAISTAITLYERQRQLGSKK
jgi:23S rRNA (guanosine2251-2'-O)-methyltransferase